MRALLFIILLTFTGSVLSEEVWECRGFGLFVPEGILVTAIISDAQNSGTIHVSGFTHKTKYRVDGFNRRWDFGGDEKDFRFSFFISPSGQGAYFDFGDGEEAEAEQNYLCRIKENGLLMDDLKELSPEEAQELEDQTINEELDGLSPEQLKYYKEIRSKITRNWRQPVNAGSMPSCNVRINQSSKGNVLDVSFGECPGTREYRLSIESAILKSDPLPLPDDPRLFEEIIYILFKPN